MISSFARSRRASVTSTARSDASAATRSRVPAVPSFPRARVSSAGERWRASLLVASGDPGRNVLLKTIGGSAETPNRSNASTRGSRSRGANPLLLRLPPVRAELRRSTCSASFDRAAIVGVSVPRYASLELLLPPPACRRRRLPRPSRERGAPFTWRASREDGSAVADGSRILRCVRVIAFPPSRAVGASEAFKRHRERFSRRQARICAIPRRDRTPPTNVPPNVWANVVGERCVAARGDFDQYRQFLDRRRSGLACALLSLRKFHCVFLSVAPLGESSPVADC